MSFILGYPYRSHPHKPYWAPQNAPENWCEEDYIITPYIAEYINTLSNVVYIILGIRGILHVKGNPQRSLPHVGLIILGICSGMYHGTMRRWPQWADSLSMIYALAFVLQRVFTFDKSVAEARRVTVLQVLGVGGYTILHCVLDNLTVHSVVFVGMLFAAGFKGRELTKRLSTPEERERMGRKARRGDVYGLVGFVVWVADNLACEYLGGMRRAVGLPWGFLLEFHGWWHILTAVGAHMAMNTADELVELNRVDGKKID